MNNLNILRKSLINIPGWSTKLRLIVIESDDWGAIRTPSREFYELAIEKGIDMSSKFRKYDCLESEEDLSQLFQVLSAFTDKNGNHPVITANAVVANPDFEAIEKSNFGKYVPEPISTTYKLYKTHGDVLKFWKDEGIGRKLLIPELHGREHLSAHEWLHVLRLNHPHERYAFENQAMLGAGYTGSKRRFNYLGAFDSRSEKETELLKAILNDAYSKFNDLFSTKPSTFVPPNGVMHPELFATLSNLEIKYLQAGKLHLPDYKGNYKYKRRFIGGKNKLGQVFWSRNVQFEPGNNINHNYVEECLKEIEIAFRYKKPAIINSHRVNYIGSIFPENRKNTLSQLNEILSKALKKWPDVEFITSGELGKIIDKYSSK